MRVEDLLGDDKGQGTGIVEAWVRTRREVRLGETKITMEE